MISSISPYELLCASKPKPAPTIVTPYDLYSQAQHKAALPAQQSIAALPLYTDMPPEQPAAQRPASISARRTHYIADIQSRHSAAVRRTPMRNQPLT